MAASFSPTAYNRLPVSVKGLSREAQTACIFMRLRKTEGQIAQEMAISIDEAARLANTVRRALISSGEYDLIADPVMVSLSENSDNSENGKGGLELASAETGMEEHVLISEFISALGEATAGLNTDERRLLHLFFERGMTGAQILDFMNKGGQAASQTKPLKSESDVYYMLEKVLKGLVSRMADDTPIGRGTLTVKGLKDIFSQTGVPA